jgi:acetyltransferase-like isoleucine patch superfamily enzyme
MNNPFDQGFYDSSQLRFFGFKGIGNNVKIAKNCTIVGLENIEIGDNVRIDSNTCIFALDGYLNVGSYIHIGTDCLLAAGAGISLDDFCGLSHGVKIFSKSDDFSGKFMIGPMLPDHLTNVKAAPVILKKHVIVGACSVILPGVTLDEGAAVGALTLIRKNCMSWIIYSGHGELKTYPRHRDILKLEKLL